MKRFALSSILALLAACAVPQQAAQDGDTTGAAATVPASGTVCRIGPDGGPLVAGAGRAKRSPTSQPQPAQPMVADRGIGGTGAPQGNAQLAERGIGGTGIGGTGIGGTGIGGAGIGSTGSGSTGIVGVITGFASVCVDGLEVAYDRSATIDIDGLAGTSSALRVGQIVVIEARGLPAAPIAQRISVRRQVTGRIESIELASGTLTIAGQTVSVPTGTWGADAVGVGDWVAVSGLRRADGMLIASRLDLAPAGALAIRGQIIRNGDTARVGQLDLNGTAAAALQTGQYVLVSGQYAAGLAQIQAVIKDPPSTSPDGYFGTSVNHLILQAYVRVADGAIYLNGRKVAAGPGVSGKPGIEGVATVSLEREADGSFTAVGLRYTDPPAAGGHAANPTPPPALAPPPARPGAAVAALSGNNREPPSSAGQRPSASTGTISSAAATPGSADTIAASPSITPPPTVTTTPTLPVGSGVAAESLPEPPATSRLMSRNTRPSGTVTAARKASGGTHTVAAWRPASPNGSVSSSTVSLATQAETAPAGATATTPAVVAPAVANPAKPVHAAPRHATTGSGQLKDH